ncbi:MAG: TetR/AcrR family transcriptional regulator [Paracoccaceae bacterium]|nr:TetR/AcrR family transcriptional regulator [Paracoccaceae bacterium]
MTDASAANEKRKRLPSEERREEFVQKAIEFFAEEGFDSSTRELAKRLGVTQPLLYRYFDSKDDLIAEVYKAVYVRRWRSEWDEMLADRTVPLRDRLVRFYHAYAMVVFQRDWMRIFLFAGLKGGAINRRYIDRVRDRILEPIIREYRHENGLFAGQVTDDETELAWSVHGGIYYYGVRTEIYGQIPIKDLNFVIETSIDSLLSGLDRFHEGTRRP